MDAVFLISCSMTDIKVENTVKHVGSDFEIRDENRFGNVSLSIPHYWSLLK